MADSVTRAGERYATLPILDYVNASTPRTMPALARAFAVPEGIPAIQVGPSDGKLIELCSASRREKVVEVGTLVGYSAIHMARALAADGHLWSIEFEPKHAEVARANLAAAGVADRVTVLVGAGRDVLPTLIATARSTPCSSTPTRSTTPLRQVGASTHLRRGGLVLGDNAYLFGELLEDTDRGRAMRAFHELVAASCDSVCAPTPDGLVDRDQAMNS